jgi:hypothetical protein
MTRKSHNRPRACGDLALAGFVVTSRSITIFYDCIVDKGMCQSVDRKNNSCIDHNELIDWNMIIYMSKANIDSTGTYLQSTRLEMIIRVLLQLTPAS